MTKYKRYNIYDVYSNVGLVNINFKKFDVQLEARTSMFWQQ